MRTGVLLAAMTAAALAGPEDPMYLRLMADVPDFQRAAVDQMFRYCFRDSFCLEIFADESRDTEILVGLLHASAYTPGLIYGETEHVLCRDRLFVSRSVVDTWEILVGNRAPEVRFFLFLAEVDQNTLLHFLDRFQNESSVLQYSAGHIIDLTDTTTVYSYNIIQNRFIKYNTSDIKLYEAPDDDFLRSKALIKDLWEDILSLYPETCSRSLKKYESNSYQGTLPAAPPNVVEDFGGKLLTVATFNCSIHSHVGPLDANGFPAYIGGAEMRFFDMLSRKLNYTYSIVPPTGDDMEGEVFKNASWTKYGIIGLIGERKADVGFCSIPMTTYLRQAALDVTDSPTRLCIKFLVPRQGVVAKRGSGLVRPFGMRAWALVAAGVVVFPLLATVLAVLVGWLLHQRDTMLIKSYTSYATSFIRGWGVMLANAPRSLEELGPLRYLLASWAMMALLVSTFYTCSLRSSLLSINKAAGYDTIQRMAESGLFWAVNHKMDFNFIFNLEDYWHTKWIEKFKVLSKENQCHLLKEKKIALLSRVYSQGVLAEVPCTCHLEKYKVSTECLQDLNTAFILQDKSPYTKIFSTYINNLNENGIFIKEYSDAFHQLSLEETYVLNTLVVSDKIDSQEIRLSLYNMGSSIMLVALGNGFALLVFILELLWFYRMKIYLKLKCFCCL